MVEYLIKNGFVFDPVTGVKGDKKDICLLYTSDAADE